MAIAIVILRSQIENYPGLEPVRGVKLWVSDGVTAYVANRGNLPLEGDLLAILTAISAEVWADAQAGGQVATAAETARADFLQWQIDNPGAKAIFVLTRAQLEAEINALVDVLVPAATAANRTKLKRLLACGSLLDRVQVAEE